MVLSGIEQYGKNPAFLLVALARNTHRPFVSLPTVAPPHMYFLAFWNARVVCCLVFGCYIIACFCMLLFVLSYIRSTLQDKVTLRHLSKQLTFRFIFLLRLSFLLFASALCFTPFLIFSSLCLLSFSTGTSHEQGYHTLGKLKCFGIAWNVSQLLKKYLLLIGRLRITCTSTCSTWPSFPFTCLHCWLHEGNQ